MRNRFFSKIHNLKNSIKVLWATFYACTMILPFVANSIFYTNFQNELLSEIESNNRLMLAGISENINNQFILADELSNQLYINGPLAQLSTLSEVSSPGNKFAIRNAISQLGTVFSSLNNNHDFLIYLPYSDAILTMNLAADSRTYFSSRLSDSGLVFEDWKKTFLDNPSHFFVSQSSEGPSLYYASPFTYPSGGKVKVFICLNTSELFGNYRSLYANDEGRLFVTTPSGSSMLSQGSLDIDESLIDFSSLRTVNNSQQLKIDGKKYIMMGFKDSDSPFSLFYLLPRSAYFQKLTVLHINLLTINLISLAIGIILIVSFMRVTYKPINDIIRLFGTKRKDVDEFKYIHSNIKSGFEVQTRMQRLISKQKALVREYIAMRLLHGQFSDYDHSTLFKELGISPVSEHFMVINIHIPTEFAAGNSRFESSSSTLDESSISSVFTELIVNTLSDLGSPHVSVDLYDNLVFIVNFKDEDDYNQLKSRMQEAYEFMHENDVPDVLIILSNPHDTLYGVETCYAEVSNALSFALDEGQSGVIEVNKNEDKTSQYYYFPLEIEQKLINYICSGAKDSAVSLLESIFEENFTKNQISPELANCLIYNITGTIIKAMETFSDKSRFSQHTAQNPVFLISKCKTVAEKRESLITLVQLCCESISNKETDLTTQELMFKIKEYIKENFADPNLNVTSLSDEFGILPSTLSRNFKKYTQIGLLEYINQYRIKKAAKLLSETDMDILLVYRKVGYSNYRTFARVFLKFYGMSAQEYRKFNEENNN
ncbi:MAG: AraC family transcriptional regulator [Clostridia bacterium]|nr:AraC family transcriptional regulator [Clostridia bacterium]